MAKPKPASPLATNPQYHQIRDLILKRRARCLWQVDGPEMSHGRSVLEAWTIPGMPDKNTSILIIHVFPDAGIDLYVNGTPHDWQEIARFLGPTEEDDCSPGTVQLRARIRELEHALANAQTANRLLESSLASRDAIGGDS